MALLIGPFVAAVGLVAVFFVMRHRSVQTKSMYSARRSQIERKVRAARQRTLAPTSKHAEQEAAQAASFTAPGMEEKAAIPTATWGAPVARPEAPPPPPPDQQVWEVGPTVPTPPPSMPPPTPPAYKPSEPAYTAPPEEVWNPAPAEPYAPAPPEPSPAAPPVSTPAGGGASWSIVGDAKDVAAEPAGEKKSKKDKKDKEKRGQTGASWQLAAGELPGDQGDEGIKRPSVAIAVAQYAVLVVGLVMVLIGVVVMVANAHVT